MKEDAGQTLARQWEMLRAVPRAPRKITTAELEVHLKDRGYGISRRSIERDLQKLSAWFPLT
ncbi:MAG: WYL domain-containing protein, partial [Gammaproteobacteria bacterium]|nr:WYL domain-containing protein [Gammaproteobacteria bacterium]